MWKQELTGAASEEPSKHINNATAFMIMIISQLMMQKEKQTYSILPVTYAWVKTPQKWYEHTSFENHKDGCLVS